MRRILIVGAISALCLSAEEKKLRSFDATSGYGNILYPGTGRPPAPLKPTRPVFQRPSAVRGALPVVSSRPRVLILPYYFPIPFYSLAPNYDELAGYEQPRQPQQQVPPEIINRNYSPESPRPAMPEYTAEPLPEPERRAETKSIDDEKPTIYLIAMKDSTVYSSLAYWVEEDILHYITKQYSHNRATIGLIDRELSMQLNRERGVEFKLPSR
jgi:hypothetical protein